MGLRSASVDDSPLHKSRCNGVASGENTREKQKSSSLFLVNVISSSWTPKIIKNPCPVLAHPHDGSMVLLYMVCHGSHQYTPFMLAYTIHGSYGIWDVLWCLQPSRSAAASFRTPIPAQTPHLGCPLCTPDPHGAESVFHHSLGLRRPKALALESKPVLQGRLAEAQVLNHDPWNPQIPSDILSWINFTKRAERERERDSCSMAGIIYITHIPKPWF